MREGREHVKEHAQPNQPGTRQSSVETEDHQNAEVRDEEHRSGGRERPLWIGQQPFGRDLLNQQSQDKQPAQPEPESRQIS